MKRLMFLTILSCFLIPTCQGQVLVYRMLCVENAFDLNDVCPAKELQVVHGFVALEVDLDEVAALECGESVWTLDAAVVRFGRQRRYRWRCVEYPLVRIYQLGENRLCVSIESLDEDMLIAGILNGEPNEPNLPVPAPEPEGAFGKCFTCIIDGRNSNRPVPIGDDIGAAVPRVLSGRCIYNGDRIKGNGRCALQLNLPWTRLANKEEDTPQEVIDKINNQVLSRYNDLGYCCDPDESYPDD